MSDRQLDSFAERAQTVLQDSAERLDGATRSRLTQARHAALDAVRQRERKPRFWLMPASGAVAAAVLGVMLLTNPASRDIEAEPVTVAVDEFEIITAEDSLEFYRDIEFYAWLETVLEEEPADSDV